MTKLTESRSTFTPRHSRHCDPFLFFGRNHSSLNEVVDDLSHVHFAHQLLEIPLDFELVIRIHDFHSVLSFRLHNKMTEDLFIIHKITLKNNLLKQQQQANVTSAFNAALNFRLFFYWLKLREKLRQMTTLENDTPRKAAHFSLPA